MLSCQIQPYKTRPNLLVLDDVEHELIEQADETEAARPNFGVLTKLNQPVLAKPNQPVITKINLLVLNDVEHELVV
jgi:hypothetical protein